MSGFDTFAIVDWSAGNDTGPTPRKNAIWAAQVTNGVAVAPTYLRNRVEASAWLSNLIAHEIAAQRRLLIGFDFPFGYPVGFAHSVTGSFDPLALWAWMATNLRDAPNANTRFDLAGQLNTRFPGVGPFWFNGLKRDILHLPRKGSDRQGHGMGERRKAEIAAKGAFTCWQMGGAGAVGGQAMTGIAALQKLRDAFPNDIAVWPFEPLTPPVAFVEVWPSLIDTAVRLVDDIRDRVQVDLLAKTLSCCAPSDLKAMLADGKEHSEEGWILGLGREDWLTDQALRYVQR